MTKTLNQILAELYRPNPDTKENPEVQFINKHVVQKIEDRNGNGDDVFKATNVKTHKRKPKHGFDTPDDAKVNEDVETVDENSRINHGGMYSRGKARGYGSMPDGVNTATSGPKGKAALGKVMKQMSDDAEKKKAKKEVKEIFDKDNREDYLRHHAHAMKHLQRLMDHLQGHKADLEKMKGEKDWQVNHPHHEMKQYARQIEDLADQVTSHFDTEMKTDGPMISSGAKNRLGGTKYSNYTYEK